MCLDIISNGIYNTKENILSKGWEIMDKNDANEYLLKLASEECHSEVMLKICFSSTEGEGSADGGEALPQPAQRKLAIRSIQRTKKTR